MLKTFFENEMDWNGVPIQNAHYFDHMKFSNSGNEYLSRMGKYPVISLSLKAAKQPTLALSYAKFPKPYWSNTSSNSIIRTFIDFSDSSVKKRQKI